jgi:hypothetical protein
MNPLHSGDHVVAWRLQRQRQRQHKRQLHPQRQRQRKRQRQRQTQRHQTPNSTPTPNNNAKLNVNNAKLNVNNAELNVKRQLHPQRQRQLQLISPSTLSMTADTRGQITGGDLIGNGRRDVAMRPKLLVRPVLLLEMNLD